MENFKDLVRCRCHGRLSLSSLAPEDKSGTPAHTFPWAKTQYAEDRPVWPLSQSLDLVLNVEKEEISGSNTLQVKCLWPEVATFKVDSVDLRIHDVLFNGKPVEVFLDKPFKRGDTGDLKITYTCHKPKAGIYFIKPDKNYPQRPTQVWTQGQDDDARYWFPCFDEPRIKCSFDLKVEVPAGYIATSNGALQMESRGGKTWTFHWKSSAAIPSYLVTLTAGLFSEIKEDWRGKPVIYLCEKGREDETKLSFGKTPQMMEFFSKVTGVDYPFEKYAQITAAEFIFGGMENISATTQTDHVLHPYEIEEDYSSDDLVAHELAHQWFGDLVTCKTWSHAWLNEGWATFMETVFKEQDLGKDESDYFRYDEFRIYQSEDQSLYRRPVVSNFYSDPGEVWDRHIYQKGGLVLNLLRHELGETDFWAGVKNYLQAHRGGVVETVDFQRALEQASSRNLQSFFDQWIFKGGYPELKVSFEWDDKNKSAQLKVAQSQAIDDLTPLFNLQTQAEFFFADGTSLKQTIHLKQKEQNFVFTLKEKPSYVRIDAGGHTIKTLEWNLPLDMVKAQLHQDTDVVGKIWAMKQLAKDAAKEGVEAIAERLKKDTFWGVRAEAALALGEVKSADALEALVGALTTEKSSKVRARIATALGEFRDEKVADVLINSLEKDKSIFVRGAAAVSLGKTKSSKAFEALKEALKIKTWNDYVASACYSGLRALRDERSLNLFLEGARYGAPKFARLPAVAALGEYGLNDKSVSEFLNTCLDDPFTRVRFQALDALVRRKDPESVSYIEDSGHRVVDGHFKAAAFRAAKRLRASQERPQEVITFREDLQKLTEENRRLKDRLSILEEKTLGKAPGSKSSEKSISH